MSGTSMDTEARALVERYLKEVRDALRGTDLPRSEILTDLRTHIEEAIARSDGSVGAARTIIEALGPAEQYRETAEETSDSDVTTGGSVLGMPYDFTPPTTVRFAERWWSPANPKIMVPRVWGIGWTVNFAAIAVKLGWMRPDDEDATPFANVPERVLITAMLIPTVIAVIGVVIAVLAWPSLPAEVPTHWGPDGQPDQWGPKLAAIGFLLLVSAGPVLLGWLRGFGSGSGHEVRAFWAAGTVFPAVLGTGLIGITVLAAENGGAGWLVWLLVVVAIAVTFGMLLVMSRAGLRAEWREASPDTER